MGEKKNSSSYYESDTQSEVSRYRPAKSEGGAENNGRDSNGRPPFPTFDAPTFDGLWRSEYGKDFRR